MQTKNIDTPRTEVISACLDNDYKFEALKRIVQLERELKEAKETIATLEQRHAATMLCTQAVVDDCDAWRKVADGLYGFSKLWRACFLTPEAADEALAAYEKLKAESK